MLEKFCEKQLATQQNCVREKEERIKQVLKNRSYSASGAKHQKKSIKCHKKRVLAG